MSYGFHKMVRVLPGRLEMVETLVRAAGYGDEMVARLHEGGLKCVPTAGSETLVSLGRRVLAALFDGEVGAARTVCGVVFAHSLPVQTPAEFPLLTRLLDGFGLASIPRTAVSGQPCSVLHMAIQLCCHWLNTLPPAPTDSMLLLSVDQVYSPHERIFFGSAMGDAAIAALITRQTTRDQILASVSQTKVFAFEGENSPPEAIAAFRKVNPFYIRHAIESCLKEADLSLDALDFIVPHTPYLAIWDVVAKLLRYPRECILTDYLSETGHLNSNDVFVHYVRAVEEGKIGEGQHAMMVSPGFGGTRGCTLLRH